MDLLLDTHTFIWFISGDDILPPKVVDAIDNYRPGFDGAYDHSFKGQAFQELYGSDFVELRLGNQILL